MSNSLHGRVLRWCNTYPETAGYLQRLHNAQLHVAINGGTHVQLMTGARKSSSDLDLTLPLVHLEQAVSLAPRSAKLRHINKPNEMIRCGDGTTFHFPLRAVVFELEKQAVEIVATGEAANKVHHYNFALTAGTWAARRTVTVNDITCVFMPPFDVVALKAMLRRSGHKRDESDIRALASYGLGEPEYIKRRAKEIGFDDHLRQYARALGVQLPKDV